MPVKLARPSPPPAINRERLFDLLDKKAGARVVWLSGPGGSGKTTLAAGYVLSRDLPCLWYQVDQGDRDPSDLFFFLRLAASHASPRRKNTLPLFSPEYYPGLSAFTLRFFHGLGGLLPARSVIVFDNAQEAEEGPLHGILLEGLSRLPSGMRVLVLSRTHPPAPFARLLLNGEMAEVGWDELKLTLAEVKSVERFFSTRAEPFSREELRRLWESTEGWAAGVRLALEAGSVPGEVVLGYFGEEIFNRLAAGPRRFLKRTAFLPRFSVRLAEELSGDSSAEKILRDLHQRQFFITHHPGSPETFQYHPLFRDFLLSEGKKRLSAGERRSLSRRAAHLLAEDGQIEDAARLYRESRDWGGLASLLRGRALELLESGRHRLLAEWAEALPERTMARDPWLLYWTGAALMPFDPARTQALMERALGFFRRRKDPAGTYLALAGTVEAIVHQRNDFHPLDRFFSVFERIRKEHPVFPSIEIEAQVMSALLFGILVRQPQHPRATEWGEKAVALAGRWPGSSLHIQTLWNWSWFNFYVGRMQQAQEMFLSSRKFTRNPHVSGITRVLDRLLEVVIFFFSVETDKALASGEEGLRIAKEEGFHLWDNMILGHTSAAALGGGLYERARKYLALMESDISRLKNFDLSCYQTMAGWMALGQGDYASALDMLRREEVTSDRVGNPVTATFCRFLLAELFHEMGDEKSSRKYLAEARRRVQIVGGYTLDFFCGMTESYLGLENGDLPAARRALKKGLAAGREQKFYNFFGWRDSVMSRLCAFALQEGIETDYVRELIRRHRLAPPSRMEAPSSWPWPVVVRTLGGFGLEREGEPLRFTGKGQKRPLLLLKALVAQGGREVSEDRLSDLLWPNSEGDAARQAFNVTLHRLRGLVGREAIVVSGGCVTLDPGRVWVDAWALEEALSHAEGAFGRDADEFLAAAQRACGLFRGPFLPEDEGEEWTSSTRERLRSRFLRHMDRLSRHWERSSSWEKVLECCEAVLEKDPLAEEFHRRLMKAYLALGRRAEAKASYLRCREALAKGLGLEPGAETLRLARQIV